MGQLSGDGLEPLTKAPPLRQRVHERIEGLITSGALSPGTRLVELDLAETLAVSRGPVREALQLLSRDGFVDLVPGQGAFVHLPTQKEVVDFFDVRRALESEGAALAATKVSPDGVRLLREAMARGRDILDSGEDPALPGTTRLHEAVWNLADNPTLTQLLELLSKRSVWYLSPYKVDQRRRAWDEHEAVVDRIAEGDADGARRAMANHIDSALEKYMSLQDQHQDRP